MSKYKIDSHDIELEITESALLNKNVIVKENISRLQKLGHTFAIDDYGTGFSSLANIKTFQFDKLKIDKSFIDNLATDEDDQVIVCKGLADTGWSLTHLFGGYECVKAGFRGAVVFIKDRAEPIDRSKDALWDQYFSGRLSATDRLKVLRELRQGYKTNH